MSPGGSGRLLTDHRSRWSRRPHRCSPPRPGPQAKPVRLMGAAPGRGGPRIGTGCRGSHRSRSARSHCPPSRPRPCQGVGRPGGRDGSGSEAGPPRPCRSVSPAPHPCFCSLRCPPTSVAIALSGNCLGKGSVSPWSGPRRPMRQRGPDEQAAPPEKKARPRSRRATDELRGSPTGLPRRSVWGRRALISQPGSTPEGP